MRASLHAECWLRKSAAEVREVREQTEPHGDEGAPGFRWIWIVSQLRRPSPWKNSLFHLPKIFPSKFLSLVDGNFFVLLLLLLLLFPDPSFLFPRSFTQPLLGDTIRKNHQQNYSVSTNAVQFSD